MWYAKFNLACTPCVITLLGPVLDDEEYSKQLASVRVFFFIQTSPCVVTFFMKDLMSIIIVPEAAKSHILPVYSSFFYTVGPEMLFCYVILVSVEDKNKIGKAYFAEYTTLPNAFCI
jgi:hypothetical protein